MKYAVSLKDGDKDCFPESMWTTVDPPWTEEILVSEPYNRTIIEVDNKYTDLDASDFAEVDGVVTFNAESYKARKVASGRNRLIMEQQYVLAQYQQQALLMTLSDEQAVNVVYLYPEWNPNGIEYTENKDRVQYNGRLYKVIKSHTSQENWKPTTAPTLFTVINVSNTGTVDDPIPYSANMAIYENKYYTESGILYRAIKNSGIALHNKASELVGIYFEIIG